MTRINSAIPVECLKRGFCVSDYSNNWLLTKNEMNWQNYIPTEEDRVILVDRITERIMFGKKDTYRYYGLKVGKTEAIKLLKNC